MVRVEQRVSGAGRVRNCVVSVFSVTHAVLEKAILGSATFAKTEPTNPNVSALSDNALVRLSRVKHVFDMNDHVVFTAYDTLR